MDLQAQRGQKGVDVASFLPTVLALESGTSRGIEHSGDEEYKDYGHVDDDTGV